MSVPVAGAGSGRFRKVPEGSGRFRHVPVRMAGAGGGRRRFRRVPEGSVCEGSGGFRCVPAQVPEGSIPEGCGGLAGLWVPVCAGAGEQALVPESSGELRKIWEDLVKLCAKNRQLAASL